jgi:WD40 repeat protein
MKPSHQIRRSDRSAWCSLVLALAVLTCVDVSASTPSASPLRMKQVATWGVPGLWTPAYISAVSFSPDGQRAWVTTQRGHFIVWDVTSRRQEALVQQDYGIPLAATAISSTGMVAFGRSLDGGGSVEVYEPLSGKQLYALTGPSSDIQDLAFSGDGSRIAASADAGPVLLWDLSRKARVRRLFGPKGRTFAVALSANGSRVIAGGEDGQVRVWDGTTGRLLRNLRAGSRHVRGVALSPDGRFALSGGDDRTARLWDLRSGKQVWSQEEDRYPVTAVFFSKDGNRAVISGDSAYLLDVQNRQVLAKLVGASNKLALSPDGSLLASGGGEELWLVNVRSGQEARQALGSHTTTITSLAISLDGTRVASGDYSTSVRLWDTARGTSERLLSESVGPPMDLAFSWDGNKLLSTGRDGTIHLWDLLSGQPSRVLVKLQTEATALAASPAGPLAVFAGQDGRLHLWDLMKEKESSIYGEQRRAGYQPIVISSDGQRIFAAREDRGVDVWDTGSGKLLHTLVPSEYAVTSLSSRGDLLVAGTRDGIIQLWKVSTGESLVRLSGHKNPVRGVALSPDARSVVSVGQDQTLRLWNVQSGAELDRTNFSSSGDMPTAVVFEPTGRSFLVGMNRGLILRFALEGSQ